MTYVAIPASALLFQNHALSVADDLGDSFDYTFLDESSDAALLALTVYNYIATIYSVTLRKSPCMQAVASCILRADNLKYYMQHPYMREL